MAHIYDDAPLDEEELVFLDHFGAAVVYGGIMSVSDMRRVITSRRILGAYRAREAAENMAEWATKHPHDNDLLTWAERIYNDGA